ncbi:hypothetical protein QFC19_008284 [Naganishia cerealis]|uniref:Uncharacterized protein n=1 Tax=Naganishia cerealis TaxID=610337 RepID=A0ACC2V454_9TREE|nr:hypothetical protein QFC19_008284 [Naganishia cerealis]
MWILQIRELNQKGVYEYLKYAEKSLPLKQSKTYYLGRAPEPPKAQDDTAGVNAIVLRQFGVAKRAARIKVDEWQRYFDRKTSEIVSPLRVQICPKVTYFPDEFKGSAKAIVVWQPLGVHPEDSHDERHYMKSSEATPFVIQSGTIVHITDDLKIRFVWQPVIIADADRTPERANQYGYLNEFLIYNSLEFLPNHTSFVIKKEIFANDRDCLSAVSSSVPIVSPEWLNSLQLTIQKTQEQKTPQGIFQLPVYDKFPPVVDPAIDDVRRIAAWWSPQSFKGVIWKGITVVTLGGKSPLNEEQYFRSLGANVRHLDVLSPANRVTNWEDFYARLQPCMEEADKFYRKCLENPPSSRYGNIAIALGDNVIDSYSAVGVMFIDILMGPLEKLNIPINFAQNWWTTLTNGKWSDFSSTTQHDNDIAMESQSHGATSASPSQVRTASQAGTSIEQQSVGIPSTHPEEQAPTQQSGPKRKLQLRARQGRQPFSVLGKHSDNERDDENEMPQRKRSRVAIEEAGEAKANTLAHDSVEAGVPDTQKSNASVGSGLKRRAGKARLGLLHSIGESDDDFKKPQSSQKDTLHAYRSLYNSIKQSGANPSQADSGTDAAEPEEEEDFVQRSINRQKNEAEATVQAHSKANQRQEHTDDQEMGFGESRPHVEAKNSTAAHGRPLHAPHIEPTRPEGVTKDTEFLQTITKARKGAKEPDEFDLEFNALKIARPKKSAPPKVYGAGLFDASTIYNSVLDLDTDVTGNFIKIERVNLFRKDKELDPAPKQDWAGRPNFKKFRKVTTTLALISHSCLILILWLEQQEISRRAPVKLNLAPAADFGIGLEYWPDTKASNAVSTEPLQYTQNRVKKSQVPAEASHSTSQFVARPKRRLLRVDSEDEDGVMALPTLARDASGAFTTQTKQRKLQATPTMESSSATGSRQSSATARPKVAPIRASSNLLAVESDEETQIQPAKKTYQKVNSRASRGESSRAEELLGSATSSHTASIAPSTNKRKRLIPMDDDDDNDMVNMPLSWFLGILH